ncbi:two-component system sensor histidine kinase MprB [Nocardiopsis sp. Huas11]|uniref:sensor histidine kinase n=1 Tax=Nocardiopsis sp. Huas11 TaxID=2183912 RepID=UPI000EACAFA8|nr:HAMP domain-containing sensor histidine kinase [Nocardiopsis sp. Huas11]RKS07647.1 two-component system sensor histidine kinase MprB [Nocardiopsis sp. Huas11]
MRDSATDTAPHRFRSLLTPSGWRLGTRFAVLFAVVVGVTIALVGTLAYSTAATLIRSDAKDEFDRSVSSLSEELVGLHEDESGASAGSVMFLAGNHVQVQFMRPDGARTRPIADPGGAVDLKPDEQDLAVATYDEPGVVESREKEVGGQTYRVATVSVGDGVGAFLVVQRLSPTESIIDRLATQILWVGLFIAIAAASVGWLVGHRVTGRLARLTDAAEYVSSTGRLDPVTAERDGDGSGGALGTEDVGRDEVGRLGTAFNAMLARLTQSQDEQRRLVQDAAHELRTPLTSLYTNVQVLGRVDRLTPQARDHLIDDLRGEARELTALVNELVGLATGDHETETPTTVRLGDVAESVAARVRRRTGREIIVDADDSTVWGRPKALERAVVNPVENSAKFDTEGTEPIEIRIRAGAVEVSDRGPGIDPAELDHVFERFYRATVARGLPGSGLGLSMVRDIAQAHGGRVFARNRVGGGAVIGFELPVIPPDDAPPPNAPPPGPAGG